MKCQDCNKEVEETCGDGFCRDCHVSLSFEDCTTGTWTARILMSNGHTREYVKQIYPNANI